MESPAKKYFFPALLIAVLAVSAALKTRDVVRGPRTLRVKDQLGLIDHQKFEFSFAVFGDNRNSLLVFNRLMEMVNNDEPLFSILLGDFVFTGEKYKHRTFISQAEKIDHPLLILPGNHEVWDNDSFRENYEFFYGPTYYSFSVGEAYFMVLDNSDYKLFGQRYEWLETELKKSLAYKHRFVFAHVPLFDPRSKIKSSSHSMEDIEEAQRINKLLDDHGVAMIFTSHIHAYYEGSWDKTPYVVTGGGGAKLKGAGPESDFNHYVKVDVSAAGVEYHVRKIEAESIRKIDPIIYEAYLAGKGFGYEILIVLCLGLLAGTAIKFFRGKKASSDNQQHRPVS